MLMRRLPIHSWTGFVVVLTDACIQLSIRIPMDYIGRYHKR